jgi:hypothetical protein
MTKTLASSFMGGLCATVLSIAALACTPMIDGSKVESTIKDTGGQKGITLTTITCPKDQKVQAGATFTCPSTTSDGDSIAWEVTQKDGAGNVDFKAPNVMDQQKLGDLVEPQLTASAGGAIDMKCPSKWIVPKTGAKFSCDATLADKPATVDCTFGEGTNYDCKLHAS